MGNYYQIVSLLKLVENSNLLKYVENLRVNNPYSCGFMLTSFQNNFMDPTVVLFTY